ENIAHAGRQCDCPFIAQASVFLDQIPERMSFDMIENEISTLVVDKKVEQFDDVAMIESLEKLRLPGNVIERSLADLRRSRMRQDEFFQRHHFRLRAAVTICGGFVH